MVRRRNRGKIFLGGLVLFVLVGGLAFLGVQFVTKTGIFRVPGVVTYDESLTEAELGVLSEIFTDEVELDSDVKVSAEYLMTRPEPKEGEYIYNIWVPTTDFYSVDGDVEVTDAEELFGESSNADETFAMTPVDELDYTRRLMSLNGKYYLDEMDSGAVFRVVRFESDSFKDEIKPLVDETFGRDWPSKDSVLTFAQTGVTAMSRGMNAKLNAVGDAKYFSQNIAEYLSQFDLTHTSNEASFTDYASNNNICSDPRFMDTLTDIGLDIVELTGNHNQDCGDDAAIQSIDMYNEKGIKVVGGGKTADDAAVPLSISEKNNNITFLAYNLSTGGATTDDTPGANQYYEDSAAADISAAKERGDFVIVDIQYYECSAYASEYEDATCDRADSAAGDQVGFFRHLIDLGADVVVGTSAHQPQTFELYGDGAIYYGLGNLFFDQIWWPGTTRSLILVHYFNNGKLLQTKIVPTVYNDTMQTKLMEKEDKGWFIQRLINVKPN